MGETFDQIDEALAGFDKSPAVLRLTIEAATAYARSLADVDAELDALAEGSAAAADAARAAAQEAQAADAARAERRAAAQAAAQAEQRAAAQAEQRAAAQAEQLAVAQAEQLAGPSPSTTSVGRPASIPPSAQIPRSSAPPPIHPASAPPPAFDDDETDVKGAAAVEAAAARMMTEDLVDADPPARRSDIAGMSVEELFADAPTDEAEEAGLGGLFDDEPLQLESDSRALPLSSRPPEPDSLDADLAALEAMSPEEERILSQPPPPDEPAVAPAQQPEVTRIEALDLDFLEAQLGGEPAAEAAPPPEPAPRPRTIPPPLPPRSNIPPPPSSWDDDDASTMAAPHFLDEDEDDDFELLVDEDVLELDGEDIQVEAAPAADAGGDDDSGDKKGLISRIFGGKS